MTKGKDFFQKLNTVNIPMIGFISFLMYSLIMGFNVASSIAAFAICGLYGFKLHLDHRKVIDMNDDLLKKLSYLESSINVLKVGKGFRTTENEEKKRLF